MKSTVKPESQPVLCKVVASIIQALLGGHASGDTIPIVSFQCRIPFESMYDLVVCFIFEIQHCSGVSCTCCFGKFLNLCSCNEQGLKERTLASHP